MSEEGIRIGVYRVDHLLAGPPPPAAACPAKASDPLMRVIPWLLVYALHLYIGHKLPLC
jgi:hypothetical protein